MKKKRMGLQSWIILCLWIPSLVIASCGNVSAPMTPEAIFARIKPAGAVEVTGGGSTQGAPVVKLTAKAGEDRYKSTCAVCHETGVGGAPKFRNEGDWKPRMAQGIDQMLQIAIQGKGAMPPKGTCRDCSDEELRLTIEYMLPK